MTRPVTAREATNRDRKVTALWLALEMVFTSKGLSPFEKLLQVRSMGDEQWQQAANLGAELVHGVTNALPSPQTRGEVERQFVVDVQIAGGSL